MFIETLVAALLSGTPASENHACSYDRDAMMTLNENAFDQDMNGGWRPLAKAGCELEAADLIAQWRKANRSESTTLYWHEGQMRASAGQNDAAVPLLEKSRKPKDFDAKWGWNFYVDGTIAFLRANKKALLAARQQLAALPEPDEYKTMKKPSTSRWPMNLHVLDAFIRCWGQSYKSAYACPAVVDPSPSVESKRAPEAP